MSGRRFRFIKEIAEGGFGKVYLAEQLSQDGFSRIVALKLLHAKWSSHDEVVMRTRDEARLLGLIRHQHIVRVEDLSSIDGKCAIIMEYLEGVDLKQILSYLQERNLQFPRAALFEIMIAVASALDAAFNGLPLQGGEPLRVIHRDIKPSNIFVTVAGGVKVLDFGTARANFAEREAKTQALAFGSQGYMAPERMLGEEDTPAADVFSLAVTLYELLALDSFGRIPPRPNKFLAKVDQVVKAVPLEGDPEWCDQVRETLRLMLAYEPRDRPTAGQLVDIFEVLAQNANDDGMRRFCRTLVAETKANQPELETGDPLINTMMDEDASGVFAMGAGGVPAASAAAPSPVVPMGLSEPPAPDVPPSVTSEPAPSVVAVAEPAVQPNIVVEEEDDGGGGGFVKIAVVLILLVVLLGGGLVVLAVLGVGGLYLFSDQGTEGPASGVAVEVSSEPEPAPPAVELPDGGKVLSADSRKDAKTSVKAVLKLDGADSALVEITGPSGSNFKAAWDGKAPFELEKLSAGRYRTNVTDMSGTKHRNKRFKVEPDKTCEFVFEMAKKNWSGECK